MGKNRPATGERAHLNPASREGKGREFLTAPRERRRKGRSILRRERSETGIAEVAGPKQDKPST